jgi:hypothetical protein
MKKLLVVLFMIAGTAGASTTLTVPITTYIGSVTRGAVLQVTLQNCINARVVGGAYISNKVQNFDASSGTVTAVLYDNTTQIDCSGAKVSFYSFAIVFQGTTTNIGSFVLVPGTFNLTTLTPCVSGNCVPPISPNGDNTYLRLDGGNSGTLFPGIGAIIAPSVFTADSTYLVEGYPGLDIGAKINAADAVMTSLGKKGTISVNTAAAWTSAANLGSGHNLKINASLTLTGTPTLTVAGNNMVSCDPGALIDMTGVTSAFAWINVAANGNIASVRDCSAKGATTATNDTTLFYAPTTAKNISAINNTVTDMQILVAVGALGIVAQNNSTTYTLNVAGHQNTGVLLLNSKQARIAGNSFTNATHGFQFSGGDAATDFSQPTVMGEVVATGNVCKGVLGACLWGTRGYSIVFSGNECNGAGDVCYDFEGTWHSKIIGNSATACTNACYAAFFHNVDLSFVGNTFNDSPGFHIYNNSGNPSVNVDLMISGNQGYCAAACTAVVFDPVQRFSIVNNDFFNGVISQVAGGFTGKTNIDNNRMTFNVAVGDAIFFQSLVQGNSLTITNNTIASYFNQSAGLSAIHAEWRDTGTSDEMDISSNKIMGGFPVDITTVTASSNAGITATWKLRDNSLAQNNIVHTYTGGIDHYRNESHVFQGQMYLTPSVTAIVPQVQLTTTASTCNAAAVGTFNYISGGTGVKDTVQVCAKDAANAYAYRSIY